MLIDVRSLTHRISNRTILDGLSFSIEAGRHTLLLGPSGSGKTTLINALTGMITPTAGEVWIDGSLMSGLAGRQRDDLRRRKISLIFQTLRLISSITVRENLLLAQHIVLGSTRPSEADEIIDQVGLAHRRDARPRELSQGEGQRAAIARALITHPSIVVADEPTSALDDANAQRMVDLLKSTAEANGATLLIATHDQRVRDKFEHTLALRPVETVQ